MKEELGHVRTNFYLSEFLFPYGVIFVRKNLSQETCMSTHILTAQHGVIGETHTQRTPETLLPAYSLTYDGLGRGVVIS